MQDSLLKGNLTPDFLLLFYLQISFLQGPVGAISNFYKKLRIYLNVKVNHRWQRPQREMMQILIQKVFPYIV